MQADQHGIEDLPESIPFHLVFNNEGPHNHPGNCMQAVTTFPSMGPCIRFKMIFVPVTSDNKTLGGRAMASKDSLDDPPPAKRHKKDDKKRKSGFGEVDCIDLCDAADQVSSSKDHKKVIIDLTQDEIIDLTDEAPK